MFGCCGAERQLRIANVVLTVSAACCAVAAQPSTRYLSYEQARPVFDALGEPAPQAGEWSRWIASADAATRARIRQGEETSVVNLLLFGTSFTRQPRVTASQSDRAEVEKIIAARVADLERALTGADSDERLQFARQVIGRDRQITPRLFEMLSRVTDEMRDHQRQTEAIGAIGDASVQFAERSQIYRTRGLSSDTSLRPNFAIHQALEQISAGVLAARAVRRVAVIGPGLDFADKQEGYDFYPVQTIQPFAVAETLIRLGLADRTALGVTTLDLNSRISAHIEAARRRARAGAAYPISLPLDDRVSWTASFTDYWRQFGAVFAREVTVRTPAGVGPLKLRAIEAQPASVDAIIPTDINVTAQYLSLPAAERFDLVVATNVFVYYNRLEQGLALAGIATMMKPGAVLLSNNALVEVPSNGLRSIGYSRTVYSTRDEDGDVIVWYQRSK